jgi:Ferritin-like
MMKHAPERVPPLSEAEKALVARIDRTWTRERALSELTEHLQIAIEVELATIPVYLYAYYSIDRTVGSATNPTGFPNTDLSRFADQAGAVVMSVAVEEMLHMSLSCNVLFALGKQPQLYGRSPSPFPTDLPGHAKLGPDAKPLSIPLAKFSAEQLWQFLEIEYPATTDAPPEGQSWQTIGQIYSYIRCIISSRHIHDADFEVGPRSRQIQPTNYSPNNIDTAYPAAAFDKACPVPAPAPGSTAHVARFPNQGDSHAGRHELITVGSKHEAMQAIATICDQGEGFDHTRVDDRSGHEESHYYKFLTLQSQLRGYPESHEPLPAHPRPPAPAARQYGPDELRTVVFELPQNPVAAAYPAGRREVAEVVSGLYQYMLIMTESIFRQPPAGQKLYFNQSLHRSMIWILDKLVRSMRQIQLSAQSEGPGGGPCLAPTFEDIDLGPRDQAFATLTTMCNDLDARYGQESWYNSDLKGYVDDIPTLPDVSEVWRTTPAPKGCDVTQYAGAPKYPSDPPARVGADEVRHACMGLNHCRGQGRTRDNACAGQGYCSTALKQDYANPSKPLVSDHTCHVLNACRGQGGCGLYGTADEQLLPGHNDCATLGSCATPINAERFSTDGPNRSKSVWLRARAVFAQKVWPSLREKDPSLPAAPPPVPGTTEHPDLFAYGPTIEWIQEYSDAGMTACGSSGMSGAGSCA